MRPYIAGVLFILVVWGQVLAQEDSGWRDLFNGRDLEGWVRRGGKATYEVVDGAIVGTTLPGPENTFLCTAEDYRDFELVLDFWVDDELNSGIQIRSQSRHDYQDGRVYGFQVEIDPSDRAYTGGIYDEGRAGWIQDLAENPEARGAFRHGSWNTFRILAEGARIRTWINGVPAVDFAAKARETGFIALQVHSVGDRQEPLRVRWRNIRLRELPPSSADDQQDAVPESLRSVPEGS